MPRLEMIVEKKTQSHRTHWATGVCCYQLRVSGERPEHSGGKGGGRVQKPFLGKEKRASHYGMGTPPSSGVSTKSGWGELASLTGSIADSCSVKCLCFRSCSPYPQSVFPSVTTWSPMAAKWQLITLQSDRCFSTDGMPLGAVSTQEGEGKAGCRTGGTAGVGILPEEKGVHVVM